MGSFAGGEIRAVEEAEEAQEAEETEEVSRVIEDRPVGRGPRFGRQDSREGPLGGSEETVKAVSEGQHHLSFGDAGAFATEKPAL